MILIRAILLSFGALFILFKVQDFWEYAVGWKNPIWPYYLAGAVLVGLIYYLDNKILPNKSKDKSRKPNSSAGLVSALALTLGLGIPAFLGTFILMNVSGIFLICTAPIALICFIGAMILLSKLGQLFS